MVPHVLALYQGTPVTVLVGFAQRVPAQRSGGVSGLRMSFRSRLRKKRATAKKQQAKNAVRLACTQL
jgi:hypothetical protein